MARVTTAGVMISIAFGAALAATYWWFVTTEAGQMLDASTFGSTEALRGELEPLVRLARRAIPLAAVLAGGVAILAAAMRRRWAAAAWGAALPVASYLLCLALRDVLLPRPYLGDFAYDYNSFPSAHMAVTVASLATAYALAPRALQGWWTAVAMSIGASLAGIAQVASFAHRVSDVVGAALLVGALGALWPLRRPAGGAGLIVLASATALAAAAAVLVLAQWTDSGYSPELQARANLGIVLAGLGASAAAFAACAGGRRPAPEDRRAARTEDTGVGRDGAGGA